MVSSAGLTVAQAVAAYLDHLKAERGLSPNTLAAYRRDLARYTDYLQSQGVDDLDEVSAAEVVGFAGWLTDQGLANSTVGRMTTAVRQLHKFALADGLVGRNVAVDVSPPLPGRRLPHALTVAEVTALIDAAGGTGADTTAAELCDRALVELLYGTGARISEAVGLDVDDVWRLLGDESAGLRLFGKGSKQRLVPVGSYARAALDAWLVRGRPGLAAQAKRATPALFLNARGARLSRQSAFNRLRALAEAAGITSTVSPHTLRHSYATHLLDGGADVRVVQELLGHSSVATTQIYTLVTVDHLREVYRQAHPRAL